MHSHRSFLSLSVLLILALLLAPWAAEARPTAPPRTDAAASQSIIDHVIGWLLTLWGDVGCTVDPSGGCGSGGSTPPSGSESLDTICTWDPNGGGCRESLDNGCTWDPNGGGCRDNG
jgi:hypothetical protein